MILLSWTQYVKKSEYRNEVWVNNTVLLIMDVNSSKNCMFRLNKPDTHLLQLTAPRQDEGSLRYTAFPGDDNKK